MKVTPQEINRHGLLLTEEQQVNFNKLLVAVNALRDACGIPFQITSGVRTKEDQLRINPKAPNSAHTRAAAVDIWDRDKRIARWCLDNLALLEKLGLYMEDPLRTPSWVHLQIIPPRSGNRVFQP